MTNNTLIKKKKLWFKAKRYGWGWTPVTWQGWLVTILFIVLVWATQAFYGTLPLTETEFAIIFIPTIVAHSFMLLGICLYKGEAPRWRWGRDT